MLYESSRRKPGWRFTAGVQSIYIKKAPFLLTKQIAIANLKLFLNTKQTSLSADAANHYNAEGLANPERIFNDLLRQQNENIYLKSKNWWIMKFFALFLDFLIFSILDGFEGIWLSKSTPWLDFLPGSTSKSIWAWIFIIFKFFCSYGVHVQIL